MYVYISSIPNIFKKSIKIVQTIINRIVICNVYFIFIKLNFFRFPRLFNRKIFKTNNQEKLETAQSLYIRIAISIPFHSLSLYAFFYSVHFMFSFILFFLFANSLHPTALYISTFRFLLLSSFSMFCLHFRISLSLPTSYSLFYSLFTSFFPFPPVFLPSQEINFMNNIKHRFEVRESRVNHRHHENILYIHIVSDIRMYTWTYRMSNHKWPFPFIFLTKRDCDKYTSN